MEKNQKIMKFSIYKWLNNFRNSSYASAYKKFSDEQLLAHYKWVIECEGKEVNVEDGKTWVTTYGKDGREINLSVKYLSDKREYILYPIPHELLYASEYDKKYKARISEEDESDNFGNPLDEYLDYLRKKNDIDPYDEHFITGAEERGGGGVVEEFMYDLDLPF